MEEIGSETPVAPTAEEQTLEGEEQPTDQTAPDVLPNNSDTAPETETLPSPAADVEEAPAEAAAAEASPTETEKPADADGADLSEVAKEKGALHVAARSGNTDTVQMLLRHKADPTALDADGQTALSIAVELGHGEVVKILNDALPKEQEATPPAETAPPAETTAPADDSAVSPVAVPADKADPQTLAVVVKTPSSELVEREKDFMDTLPPISQSPARVKPKKDESPPAAASLRADVERILGGSFLDEDNSMVPHGSMRSKPTPSATTSGVMKGPTYMVACSKWAASPKWTLGRKPKSSLIKREFGPAPGTYDLPPTERSKYKTCPRFGFGIGSRFGLSESALKSNPGPGSYNAKDPSLTVGTKVGFGTSVRSNLGASGAAFFPGPGAYELKNTMGQGLMFTAKGKQPTSYLSRSQSVPGPGAYSPSTRFSSVEAPKCGFGTSSRDSEAARASRTQGVPGPGAYEMQYSQGIGRDSKKFSATSRRRVHDLNSYLTPGPGAYNAHVTSFGY